MMKQTFTGIVGAATLAVTICLSQTFGQTQTPNLTVDQLMEKYIAATGGRAAYNKIKTSTVKATLEIAPNGLKGTFTALAKAPNLILITQNIAGIGDIRQGYDGKVGWSQDPLSGLRTLDGPELATLAREATFNGPLRWKEMFKSAQMVGVKQMDGMKVYAIKLTPAVGSPVTQYFDVKTFLLVGEDTVQESPQGSLPVHAVMSDYRVVDGIKEPFLIRQKLGPAADVTLKTTEVKNNVDLDDAMFAKPKSTESK
jgi:hypothetical protein